MPRFTYYTSDANGKAVEGTLEAASAQACVAALREQGLRVNAVAPMEKRRGRLARKGPLSWEDLDLFHQQLHAIAKSGLPLTSSLGALAHDLKRQKLRAVIERIRGRLETGASLADALDGHP